MRSVRYALVVISAAVFLQSCSATMMAPARGSSPYGPVTTQARVGVVRYSTSGAGFIVQARREDAYQQMSEDCGGRYEIAWEGPRRGGPEVFATASARGASFVYSEPEYWYIGYRCASPATADRVQVTGLAGSDMTDADCSASVACKQLGRCKARQGKCVRE